eukprot:1160429-Pelagomonas_calceolata.AAC.18
MQRKENKHTRCNDIRLARFVKDMSMQGARTSGLQVYEGYEHARCNKIRPGHLRHSHKQLCCESHPVGHHCIYLLFCFPPSLQHARGPCNRILISSSLLSLLFIP